MENIVLQKRKPKMFPLLLGPKWRSHQQVSSLTGNHLEKLKNKLKWFSFPFKNKCYQWAGTIFLNLLIVRIWLEKKGSSCSLIHSRWVLLICPDKFWISEKKRISCYHRKQWTLCYSFQLFTHLNNLLLIQWTSRVS